MMNVMYDVRVYVSVRDRVVGSLVSQKFAVVIMYCSVASSIAHKDMQRQAIK